MNELEYKNFYDKVGRVNGWDFSKIKCETVGDTSFFHFSIKVP
ncbi:SAM-dependent methyltransferase, partial [Bacillus sp. D-CC]